MGRVGSAIALGAVVAGVMVTVALAAPGQCMVSDYGSFDCEVAVDGGGVTFGLPDGQTFVFSQIEDGAGLAYLIAADAAPGERPDELGEFQPVAGEAGCWQSTGRDDRFCVMIAQ